MRDSKLKEQDIDLIIAHLENLGKISACQLNINQQNQRLLKIGWLGDSEKPVISEKEKAMFALEQNINQIEEKISEI